MSSLAIVFGTLSFLFRVIKFSPEVNLSESFDDWSLHVQWHSRIVNHTRHILSRPFLGAFAKSRLATISFVMSVNPSVRPSVLTVPLGSHSTNFHEIWYLRIFSKICRENSSFIKMWLIVPLCSNSTNFHEICYLRFFSKICRENSSSVKIWLIVPLGSNSTNFHEIWYLRIFFENMSRKFKFH